MCGCGVKIVASANAGGYANQIPLQEVSSNSTRAKFKYKFCLSPSKVNEAFSIIMVKPNEPLKVNSMSDMERLADYHDQRLDIQNYKQDLWKLLSQIKFSQEDLTKSECTTAIVY